MTLLDYKSLIIDDIKIKKPFKISEKRTFFEIRYGEQEVFLQSPHGLLPYKPFVSDDGYGYIDIVFSDADVKFLHFIEALEQNILKRLKTKTCYGSLLEEKSYQPCVMLNRVRFTHNEIMKVPVYGPAKEVCKKDIRELQKDNKHACIFQVKGVMVRANTYSIVMNLIQIHVLSVNEANISMHVEKYRKMLKLGVPLEVIRQGLLLEGFSKDESEDIVKKIKNHTGVPHKDESCALVESSVQSPLSNEFAVYNRMLKMGVPKDAVKQKMRMDGLTEEAVARFCAPPLSSSQPKAPPPPPPPPPPPLFKAATTAAKCATTVDPSAFLADIKNGNFSLKKATAPTSDNNVKNRVLRLVDTRFGAPSLAEILNAKGKLRSIRVYQNI